MRKKNYIDTHLLLGRNLLRWTVSKSPSCLYEVVRTNFPQFSGLFANFDRNFANIVAPFSDHNENYVAHMKRRSLGLLKNMLKDSSKSICKQRRNYRSNYAPLERTQHYNYNGEE